MTNEVTIDQYQDNFCQNKTNPQQTLKVNSERFEYK